MGANITTPFLFKRFAGIAGNTNDNEIQAIIDRVCSLVGLALDRTLLYTERRSWIDGSGDVLLELPEWPINSIYRVAINTDDAIRDITYSGTGEHADVSVSDSALTLHHEDSAGDQKTNSLAFATYKTCTALAVAIAAVSDWSCSLQSGYDNYATKSIKPMGSTWAKSPDDVDLMVPDEGVDVRVCHQSDRFLERIDGANFPAGRQNLFVWYVAGYTMNEDTSNGTALQTVGTIPLGLVQIVNEIVRDVFQTRKAAGMFQSESIGDYSYSRAPEVFNSAVNAHWQDLRRYARISA